MALAETGLHLLHPPPLWRMRSSVATDQVTQQRLASACTVHCTTVHSRTVIMRILYVIQLIINKKIPIYKGCEDPWIELHMHIFN